MRRSEANAVSTKLCGLRIGDRGSHSVALMPWATACGIWSVTKLTAPRTRTQPAPQDQTCRDSQMSEAVQSTTARAEQGGKRRQHEALRPSSWKAVLAFSGSDATSDSMRRMERHEGHGAKNSHSTGTAGSQTCNARASRRPCDVHERACDAARHTPSARSFAAFGLEIGACIPWL